MCRMRFLLVLGLICGVWQWANAQIQIRGQVQDAMNQTNLANAGISLLTLPDSVPLKGTRSNEKGHFVLSAAPEARYCLVVTYIGYQKYRLSLQVNSTAIQLDTIRLRPQIRELAEVVIRRQIPPVTVKKDTIEYNPDAFPIAGNAVVEKLLGKLPGITVDADGTIKAGGQVVSRILVNGKPFFDGDPKMATRNLPVELVAKIQLINQKSDKTQLSGMDDGNRNKVINILIKKDRLKGVFGDQVLSLGPDQEAKTPRYSAKLNLNRFREANQFSVLTQANNTSPGGNGSINRIVTGGLTSYTRWKKNTDLSVNYRVNRTKSRNEQQSIRSYALPDTSYQVQNASLSTNQTMSHSLSGQFNGDLDSLTSFRVNANFSFQPSVNRSGWRSQTFLTDDKQRKAINQSTTENTSNNQDVSGSVNAFFVRNFRKKDRNLLINYTLSQNQQQTRGFTRSTNAYLGGRQSQRIDQENGQTTWSMLHQLTVSYTEPVSEKNKLESHYRLTAGPSYSGRTVRDYNPGTNAYDKRNDSLSNYFRSRYPNQAAGLLFQRNQGQNLLNIGLDVQQAQLRNTSGDRTIAKNFTSLLPTAMVSVALSDNQFARFSYQGQTQPPSVDQLQPVANNTNPLFIRLGNPSLRQEFSHSLNLNYDSSNPTSFESLSLNVNASQVRNRIVESVRFNEQRVQTSLPINTNGHYTVSGNVNYGRPLKGPKLQINAGSSVNYSRSLTLVNNQENRFNTLMVSSEIALNSSYEQRLGYNLRTMVSYQSAHYSLEGERSTLFMNMLLSGSIYYEWASGLRLSSDATYQRYGGNTFAQAQRYTLWNVVASQKFLSHQQAEIQLYVFDLLNQNRSVTRTATELYTEERQNRALSRYVLVSFLYHFRDFGKAPAAEREQK